MTEITPNRSQQMKDALAGVDAALRRLIDVWDQELVVYFPKELGELGEVAANFEEITVGNEEEALWQVLSARNPNLQMEIMHGSGALFIYTGTVTIGVDRNLGDSWNVQVYPNWENDSESYNLDLGLRGEPTVAQVAKELEPILLSLTKAKNPGAKISDPEAMDRIAATLRRVEPDTVRVDAIRMTVSYTGRETT